MDDFHHAPTPEDERNSSTAAKLRALREKLGESLDTHRRRATDIELDLNVRSQQIDDEVARERQDEVEADNKRLQAELNQLHAELANRDEQFTELAERLNVQIEAVKAKSFEHAAEVKRLHQQLEQQQADRESAATEEAASRQQEEVARLQESLSQRDDELECRAKELSAGQQEAEVLRRELEEYVENNRLLAAELEDARHTVEQLQTAQCVSCEKLGGDLTKINAELEQIHTENEKLHADQQLAISELNAVQSLLDEEKSQRNDLQSRLEASQLQIAELQPQLLKAHAALDAAEKEREISHGELASATAVQEATHAELSAAQSELKAVQAKLEAMTSDQEVMQATIDTQQADLSSAQAKHESAVADFLAMQAELESSQSALDTATVGREAAEEELSTVQSELKTLQSKYDGSVSGLEEAQLKVAEMQAELASHREDLDSAIAERKAFHTELLAAQSELSKAQSEHDSAVTDLESLQRKFAENQAELESSQSKFQDASQELERARDEIQSVRAELQTAQARIEAVEQSDCPECAAAREELSQSEQLFQQAEVRLQELGSQYDATSKSLEEALEKDRDAHQTLLAAEARIQELTERQNSQELAGQTELIEVRAKFELALADLQELRRENAELQEKIANRPEPGDGESPTLVSLRAERDALASKLEELESTTEQVVDEDLQQQLADLQQRFEMAVDDLRELKQENSKLKDRLASSGSSSPALSDDGCLDWQAQKARLLAALESEDEGTLDEVRKEERTTIQGTIAITDNVVAAREKEIEELKARLESQISQAESMASAGPEIPDLFDQDEVIQAERERLEKLEHEWKDKLRQAELEMSVQRATLARRENELQQKLAMIQQAETDETRSTDGKPRRRWLSALGLRDEDTEDE